MTAERNLGGRKDFHQTAEEKRKRRNFAYSVLCLHANPEGSQKPRRNKPRVFVQQLPLPLTSHLLLYASVYEIVMIVVKQMQINNGWMNTSWDELIMGIMLTCKSKSYCSSSLREAIKWISPGSDSPCTVMLQGVAGMGRDRERGRGLLLMAGWCQRHSPPARGLVGAGTTNWKKLHTSKEKNNPTVVQISPKYSYTFCWHTKRAEQGIWNL